MGDPQGYVEVISGTDVQIYSTSTHFRRPCILMVDTESSRKMQLYYWKSEVKVLGSNAQVWRQDPQFSTRGECIQQRKRQHSLVGRHMQVNEKHQTIF